MTEMEKNPEEQQNQGVSIPLTEIRFLVEVSGVMAEVRCVQKYRNDNPVSVEAVYVFPLPEEASVVGCEMRIGQKRIVAELKERQQAREEYDDAVASGHKASLLEQKRPNIFTMNVGGIAPGEEIEVVTSYNHRVPWQGGGGRLTIPTVVAPRFIPGNPVGKTGGGWSPDTDEVPDASQITPVVSREGVPYTVSVYVRLAPGFEAKVTSPSHDLLVDEFEVGKGEMREVDLSGLKADRDFILCYQAQSDVPEVVVHRGSFQEEEFLMISVVPPFSGVVTGKDVVLCLDVSGSMEGAKLAGLKLVVEKLTRKLQQEGTGNRVGLVAFNNRVRDLCSLREVDEKIFSSLQELEACDGTYAGRALDHCFDLLQAAASLERKERYVVLVSDGQTSDYAKKAGPGRVISVGIDTATNLAYLGDIARATGGTSLAIYPGEDYDVAAATLFGILSGPVLRDIEVVTDGERGLGLNSAYKEMPAVLLTRLNPQRTFERLHLLGTNNKGERVTIPIDPSRATECDFIHQVWAREKLRSGLPVEEQVEISLRYGVLCSQTAFVAVCMESEPGQQPVRVEIPVELPHTWNYSAVFGSSSASGTLGVVRTRGGIRSRGGSKEYHTFGFESKDLGGEMTRGGGSSPHFNLDYKFPTLTPETPNTPISPSQPLAPKHVVDSLEEFYEKQTQPQSILSRGSRVTDWVALTVELLREFRSGAMDSWTWVQKVKCYYLLIQFKLLGFAHSMGSSEQEIKSMMTLLFQEPPQSETEAHGWWVKAQELKGIKVR